jgi:hypothetical protein
MVEYNPVTNSIQSSPGKRVGVFPSLVEGFEHIAEKPYLVLPPLILDLFIWLGPRLKVERVVDEISSLIDMSVLPTDPQGEISTQIELVRTLLEDFGARFNLLTSLSSIPIGVPSLIKARMPLENPLGTAMAMEVASPGRILALWLVLAVLGVALGALYHRMIAHPDRTEEGRPGLGVLWGRLLLFTAAAYLLLGALMTVVLIVVSVAGLLSTVLSVILTVLGFSLIFWVALFFVFTPHGMVRNGLGLFRAVLESVQLVRWNVRSTIWYLTLAFIISWLTGQVWFLPAEDSWFNLLAILGHAFVVTMLIAGSYIFYQSRREWLLRVQASLIESMQARDAPGGSPLSE